jgi:hypothetical protein
VALLCYDEKGSSVLTNKLMVNSPPSGVVTCGVCTWLAVMERDGFCVRYYSVSPRVTIARCDGGGYYYGSMEGTVVGVCW